jgi:hypothetical protein
LRLILDVLLLDLLLNGGDVLTFLLRLLWLRRLAVRDGLDWRGRLRGWL